MFSQIAYGNPVLAQSKSRQWNSTAAVTIPAGALEIKIVNLAAVLPATLKIGSLAADNMSPTQEYNFRAYTNSDDMRVEASQQVIITPAAEESVQIYVLYPSDSTVDLSTL